MSIPLLARLLVFWLVFPVGLLALDEPKKGAISWSSPGEGFARAAKEMRPILVVYPGGDAPGFWAAVEKQLLSSGSVKRRLKYYIAAEANKPAPEFIEKRFGELGEASLVTLLDFRGSILFRWDGEIPERVPFTRALKKGLEVSELLARRFREVRTLLEKARYALKIEKYRESVQIFLRVEKIDLPPHSEPLRAKRTVRAEFEEVYRKRWGAAAKLEKDKKLVAAVSAYEMMIHDFPFPKKLDELRTKVAELWRAIRYGG